MNVKSGLITVSCLCLAALGAAGYAAPKDRPLAVTGGKAVNYRCEKGAVIVARYFSLSDKSLDFVKVRIPGGKEYTLPRVMAASGVRYSDDHELVWWTKGNTAFVQVRGDDGEWKALYSNCAEAERKKPAFKSGS